MQPQHCFPPCAEPVLSTTRIANKLIHVTAVCVVPHKPEYGMQLAEHLHMCPPFFIVSQERHIW